MFLAVVILFRQFAEAPDGSAAMKLANDLYERGSFVEATQIYQQLADEGYGDSIVFYNLGNAYYKSGDLGRAILNYLRAERLAPRDPDIQDNLQIARDGIVDPFERSEQSALAGSIRVPQLKLSLDELARIALGLWILLALMLLLLARRFSFRRLIGYASVVVALLLLAGLFLLVAGCHRSRRTGRSSSLLNRSTSWAARACNTRLNSRCTAATRPA